eukprot:3288155-Pyramimonas_sp.AAC.1
MTPTRAQIRRAQAPPSSTQTTRRWSTRRALDEDVPEKDKDVEISIEEVEEALAPYGKRCD